MILELFAKTSHPINENKINVTDKIITKFRDVRESKDTITFSRNFTIGEIDKTFILFDYGNIIFKSKTNQTNIITTIIPDTKGFRENHYR